VFWQSGSVSPALAGFFGPKNGFAKEQDEGAPEEARGSVFMGTGNTSPALAGSLAPIKVSQKTPDMAREPVSVFWRTDNMAWAPIRVSQRIRIQGPG
jgi:hypothetical protein